MGLRSSRNKRFKEYLISFIIKLLIYFTKLNRYKIYTVLNILLKDYNIKEELVDKKIIKFIIIEDIKEENKNNN